MARSIGILCLLIIAIILFPTIASSESAWVLWQKRTKTVFSPLSSEVSWEILSATPKFDQCVIGKMQIIRNWKLHYSDYQKKYPGIQKVDFIHEEGLIVWFKSDKPDVSSGMIEEFLYCLPETVDPRKK